MEHNYRCMRIGIQVNNYFNEMSEEHGPARGRTEEGKGEVCWGGRQEKLGGGEGGMGAQRDENVCEEQANEVSSIFSHCVPYHVSDTSIFF